MTDEAIKQLIEFVSSASPFIWQTMIRQVYVNAIIDIFLAVIFVGISIFLFKIGKYFWAKTDDNGDIELWFISIISFAGSFGIMTIALNYLVYAIKYFANPNYYAIELMLEMVK